jgi:DNA invertase Pin-like site-specific DNA recombinase
MQTVAINEWLAKNTIECTVKVYEDIGSGKTMKRPALQQMLADIEAGEIHCMVSYRLDRISRKTTDALRTLMRWIDVGVEIIFVDQPILNAVADDPFRMTKYAMWAELAQVERETLSRRVKAGLDAAKKRGKVPGRPAKDHTYLIASMARMRREGMTFQQIANHLGMTKAYVNKLYTRYRY